MLFLYYFCFANKHRFVSVNVGPIISVSVIISVTEISLVCVRLSRCTWLYWSMVWAAGQLLSMKAVCLTEATCTSKTSGGRCVSSKIAWRNWGPSLGLSDAVADTDDNVTCQQWWWWWWLWWVIVQLWPRSSQSFYADMMTAWLMYC